MKAGHCRTTFVPHVWRSQPPRTPARLASASQVSCARGNQAGSWCDLAVPGLSLLFYFKYSLILFISSSLASSF